MPTMTCSNPSLNSGRGRFFLSALVLWLGALVAIKLLSAFLSRLLSLGYLGFRSTMRSRLSSLPWLRGIFVVLGILYALFSIAGEMTFAIGMRAGRFDMLQAAAYIWPFERNMREGPAHLVMVLPTDPNLAIPVLEKALDANPYSADLLLALMQYKAATRDAEGSNAAFHRLRRVLPPQYLSKAIIGSVAFN